MRLPLLFVLSTTMIDAMGIGLILPVMPALLREIGGVPLSEAALWGGLLVTVFAGMQFLCGPLVGAVSDRYGRRPVMLTTLFVMALDYLVMAIAQSFWLLFAARLVGGITAATQPTANAFIADISEPADKAARFGLVGASFGLGFVIGPLIGGFLGEYGTRAPFYAAAALAAANFVLGLAVLPETLAPENRRPLSLARAHPLGAFRAVAARPGLRPLVLLFFLYQVAFTVYPSVWAYFTEARFGWAPGMIGLSLGAFGIAMAIVQGGLIRVILRSLGERGTVLYGILFNLCAFVFLALVSNATVALIVTPALALGAVVTPALQGLMSRATPADAQGELQGVLSSASALAMVVAPMAMTAIFAAFTREGAPIFLPGAPFLLSACLMVICLAVFRAGRTARQPA